MTKKMAATSTKQIGNPKGEELEGDNAVNDNDDNFIEETNRHLMTKAVNESLNEEEDNNNDRHNEDAAMAHAMNESLNDTNDITTNNDNNIGINNAAIEHAMNDSLSNTPGAFRVTPSPNASHRGSTNTNTTVSNNNNNNNELMASNDSERQLQPSTIAVDISVEAYAVADNNDQFEENDVERRLPTTMPNSSDNDVPIAQVVPTIFGIDKKRFKQIICLGTISMIVVILVVVLATNNNDNDVASALVELTDRPTPSPTNDPRPTLTVVQERGVVNCGIEDVNREGGINLGEYNIDQCRALSAIIFGGDVTKFNLVTMGADDRYERLVNHEVDVLFAGDTFTLEKSIREVRDTYNKFIHATYIMYHDGCISPLTRF